MSDSVLALAGPPASGKLSVARAVVERLGGTVLGFGDFVRAEARDAGTPVDRESLQALGESLYRSLGATGFCEAVLTRAGRTVADRPVVWDGVRHADVIAALRTLYPVPVQLVFLRPPEGARRERFLREAGSAERFAALESHRTESELRDLERTADLVCRTQSIADAAQAALRLAQG